MSLSCILCSINHIVYIQSIQACVHVTNKYILIIKMKMHRNFEKTVYDNGCRNFTLSYIRHMCTDIVCNNI